MQKTAKCQWGWITHQDERGMFSQKLTCCERDFSRLGG